MTNSKIPRTCIHCDKSFTVAPSRIKARKVFYCSRKCYFIHRKLTAPPIADRFLSRVSKTEKCWIWKGGKDDFGYGSFSLEGRARKAHIASYKLFKGDVPEGLCVLHKCDNPPCVRPEHLFLGTKADNMHDMIQKGREKHSKGIDRPMAKLTENDIPTIRKHRNNGLSYGQIGKLFGVDPKTVWSVCNGKTWTHI